MLELKRYNLKLEVQTNVYIILAMYDVNVNFSFSFVFQVPQIYENGQKIGARRADEIANEAIRALQDRIWENFHFVRQRSYYLNKMNFYNQKTLADYYKNFLGK